MNPLYETAFSAHKLCIGSGEAIDFGSSSISPLLCEALTEEIASLKQPNVLEIGMALGTSTVHLADGINKTLGGRLIAVDPYQKTVWGGVGCDCVERAGHSDIVQLIEQPSFVALPELYARGLKFDFIFIDGWHSFDFTFVDFFFSDLLLKVDGKVAFHDCGYASVTKVLRFLESHKPYALTRQVRPVRSPGRQLLRSGFRHLGWFRMLGQALQPGQQATELPPFSDECRIYKKIDEYTVPWDMYKSF